jgi:hypothetical protein
MHVLRFTEKINKQIINDYNSRENVEKQWYVDIIKEKLYN